MGVVGAPSLDRNFFLDRIRLTCLARHLAARDTTGTWCKESLYNKISLILIRVSFARCPCVRRIPLRRFFLKTRIFGP